MSRSEILVIQFCGAPSVFAPLPFEPRVLLKEVYVVEIKVWEIGLYRTDIHDNDIGRLTDTEKSSVERRSQSFRSRQLSLPRVCLSLIPAPSLRCSWARRTDQSRAGRRLRSPSSAVRPRGVTSAGAPSVLERLHAARRGRPREDSPPGYLGRRRDFRSGRAQANTACQKAPIRSWQADEI